MPLLIIESNVLHPDDVLIEDMTVTIPPLGGFEEYDEIQEIRLAQRSYDLREFLQDNEYGVGSSTLILRDSDGPIPQVQALDRLDTFLFPQFGVDEFPITGVPGTDFILTEVPLLYSQVVYLNGQRQREGAGEDYTISGDIVTVTRALRNGDLVSIEYQHI